jgi:glycosyltransferase involved in cell wall biosynthesis
MYTPKISIITVVYNSEKLLERTIKSVLAQTYTPIEYIIVDGASTDGTLAIIEKYKPHIHKVISEKDKGIYDAMNKGLRIAIGDYVLFLNAGDELYSTTTLQDIFSLSANADVYYGNTKVVNEKGKELGDRRHTPPKQLTWKSFKYGMCVSHQSFIAKRTLCDNYNLQYPIAADIDWVIRVLKKSTKIVNTRLYISKFLEGGASSQTRLKGLTDRFKIMVHYYGFYNTLGYHFYISVRFIFQKLTGKSMT